MGRLGWLTDRGSVDVDGLAALVPTAGAAHDVGALGAPTAGAEAAIGRVEPPRRGPAAPALRLRGLLLRDGHSGATRLAGLVVFGEIELVERRPAGSRGGSRPTSGSSSGSLVPSTVPSTTAGKRSGAGPWQPSSHSGASGSGSSTASRTTGSRSISSGPERPGLALGRGALEDLLDRDLGGAPHLLQAAPALPHPRGPDGAGHGHALRDRLEHEVDLDRLRRPRPRRWRWRGRAGRPTPAPRGGCRGAGGAR